MASVQGTTNNQYTSSVSTPSAQEVTNLLQSAANGQPWASAFEQAVSSAGIGQAVAGGGAVQTGATVDPWQGLSSQDEQAAKDQIWNALSASPDRDQIWAALNQANILPGQGANDAPLASNAGNASGTQGGTAGTGGTSGGGTTGAASYSTGGTTGAASYNTGGTTGGTTGAASYNTGSTGGTGGAGATSQPSYTSTAGSTTITGAAGSTTTGSAASTTVGGVTSVSGNTGSFTQAQLYSYIQQTLQQGGGASNDLSGPANISKWDPSTAQGAANLQSYYNGIVGAQKQFYPNVPIDQFARFIVAESAAESTLQPDGGGNGDGVIQANQSVRSDYSQYGVPLTDGSGKTIASPGTEPNSTDPGTCVMLWAWRTQSSLSHGGVGPANWNNGSVGTTPKNFGNAMAEWLGGPGAPAFYQNGSLDTSSYYVNRVASFFNKTGGTSAEFNQIAGLPVT